MIYNYSHIYLSDDPDKSHIKSIDGIKVGDRISFSEWKTGDKNLSTSVSPEMIINELIYMEGTAESSVEIAILEFKPEGWFAVGSMPKSGMICKRGDDSRFIK